MQCNRLIFVVVEVHETGAAANHSSDPGRRSRRSMRNDWSIFNEKRSFTDRRRFGASLALPAAYTQDDNSTFTGPWSRRRRRLRQQPPQAAMSTLEDEEDDFDDGINGVSLRRRRRFRLRRGAVSCVGVEGEWMESEAEHRIRFPRRRCWARHRQSSKPAATSMLAAVSVRGSATNAMIYAKGGYTNAKYNMLATDGTTDTERRLRARRLACRRGRRIRDHRERLREGRVPATRTTPMVKSKRRDGATVDSFNVDVDRHQGVVGVGLRF